MSAAPLPDVIGTPAVPPASLVRHSAFLAGRSTRALLRQPTFAVMAIIQPVIWLLLFGALFRGIADVPASPPSTGPTWSSSRPASSS